MQFDEGQGGSSESAELAYEVLASASAVVGEEASEGRREDAEFIQRVVRPVSAACARAGFFAAC